MTTFLTKSKEWSSRSIYNIYAHPFSVEYDGFFRTSIYLCCSSLFLPESRFIVIPPNGVYCSHVRINNKTNRSRRVNNG